MARQFIDIDLIKSSAVDPFSRLITSALISLAGVNQINKIAGKSSRDFSDPMFFCDFLDCCKIDCKTVNFKIPNDGPMIICVPVVSGILDVFASFASIYNSSKRDDIRFLPINEHVVAIDSISHYFLDVKSFNSTSIFKSAIAHLNKGGVLICLSRISKNTYNEREFSIPLKLSAHLCVPMYALYIESITPLNHLSALGDWMYSFLLVRRLLYQLGSNICLHLSDPMYTPEMLRSYYNSVFDGTVKSLLDAFVPRGTK